MRGVDETTRRTLLVLLFVSGFAALVYELLWLRALRTIFGSGAWATSTTLAVFFAGLAAGSAVFGRVATRSARPLALYARLEALTAVAALPYFALPAVHRAVHPLLASALSWDGAAISAARIGLAFLFLLPPAFLMGGTLPLLGEVLVRRPHELASTAAVLYATNTAGAALGALAAGFWLPLALGLSRSYLIAVGSSLLLAAVAAALAARLERAPAAAAAAEEARTAERLPAWLSAYAFLGGFATLGLEVLWTRLLALVFDSSVYAFASILVVFLAALAVGAKAATRLSHLRPDVQLYLLLLGGGLAVGLSPWVLQAATGRLGAVPVDWGFAPYLLLAFSTAVVVVLPPAALCGAILPSLLRFCERDGTAPGETIGRVLAVNTAGGVAGSLVAGFGLLPVLGLHRSLAAVAVLYLALALVAVSPGAAGARQLRLAALAAAVLLLTFLDPSRLPLVRPGPGERVEHVWETPRGIVSVTRDHAGRRLRLDNNYVLGGTEGRAEERLQADFALDVHGAPRRVFLLGLGTGITAATALRPSVERVTAVEILPEVVEASRSFFADDAGALFEDPRAEVLATDGRLHLATTDDTWDVVVSDLFIPWHEGAGSLYTLEHFETVRRRLARNGVFVQWLPLFQLTRADFDVIARTMLEVFDRVDLWHADVRGGGPIAALVARPAGGDDARLRATPDPRVRFAANLAAHRSLFAAAPRNTDDHPVLEHRAPGSHAAVRAGDETWLTGASLERLLADLAGRDQTTAPPSSGSAR